MKYNLYNNTLVAEVGVEPTILRLWALDDFIAFDPKGLHKHLSVSLFHGSPSQIRTETE